MVHGCVLTGMDILMLVDEVLGFVIYLSIYMEGNNQMSSLFKRDPFECL